MRQERENYKTGIYLTIDGKLLGFRGICPFRSYIPNKIYDDVEPYLGSFAQTKGLPLGEYCVITITGTVHGSNRNVTMDICFTSGPLGRELLKETFMLTLVGTREIRIAEQPLCFGMTVNLLYFHTNKSQIPRDQN